MHRPLTAVGKYPSLAQNVLYIVLECGLFFGRGAWRSLWSFADALLALGRLGVLCFSMLCYGTYQGIYLYLALRRRWICFVLHVAAFAAKCALDFP